MTIFDKNGTDVTVGLSTYAVKYFVADCGIECRLYWRHPNGDRDQAEYASSIQDTHRAALAQAIEYVQTGINCNDGIERLDDYEATQ